ARIMTAANSEIRSIHAQQLAPRCHTTRHATHHTTRHTTYHFTTFTTMFLKASLSRRSRRGAKGLWRSPESASGGEKWCPSASGMYTEPQPSVSNIPPPGVSPMSHRLLRAILSITVGLCLAVAARAEEDLTKARWLQSTAYAVPKETATEGEGYFSIIEG